MTIQYTTTADLRPAPDLARGKDGESLGGPDSAVLRAFARTRSPESTRRRIPRRPRRPSRGRSTRTSFRYELDLAPRGPNALEDFLTTRHAGHCQTYASAMALALRSVGIPSRFVTGFLGGEIGAFGRYVLVRGANVHAWVEARRGPEKGGSRSTRPRGRAAEARARAAHVAPEAGDGRVEFFYDRFVLSFGRATRPRCFVVSARRRGGRRGCPRFGAFLGVPLARLMGGRAWAGAAPTSRLFAVLALLLRRFLARARSGTRGPPPASAAYRRLQKALHRRGAALTPSSARTRRSRRRRKSAPRRRRLLPRSSAPTCGSRSEGILLRRKSRSASRDCSLVSGRP